MDRLAERAEALLEAETPFVITGDFPVTASDCWDGYCAAVVAEAGVRALKDARRTPVEMIARPEFYA